MKIKNILMIGTSFVLVETSVGDYYISAGKKYFKPKGQLGWQPIDNFPKKVEATIAINLLWGEVWQQNTYGILASRP